MTYVLGGGFRFSSNTTSGTWSWDVGSINIKGMDQKYEITNIITPFGPLSAVASPIPGSVIQAMADSLLTLQGQLSPKVWVAGSTSYSLTVTEGGPNTYSDPLTIMNSGALGSSMNASISSDSPWLSSNPTQVYGLGKNDSAVLSALIKPSIMLSSSSPYTGNLVIQDSANPPNIVNITYNVSVLPRPIMSLNVSAVNLSWYLATSTTYGSQVITVTNSGPTGSTLDFTVSRLLNTSSWLSINPLSANSIPSLGNVGITFSLSTGSIPGIPGTYNEIVRIQSLTASNSPVDIPVTLEVFP